MPANISPGKAKKILKDGKVRGNPLTKKQKGYFGARAGGSTAKDTRKEAVRRATS